jgi:hypothetical protein
MQGIRKKSTRHDPPPSPPTIPVFCLYLIAGQVAWVKPVQVGWGSGENTAGSVGWYLMADRLISGDILATISGRKVV